MTRQLAYYYEHKDYYKAYNKEHYEENTDRQKERVKLWKRKKRLEDPLYLKIENIRNKTRKALSGYKDSSSIYDMLGCSYQEFRSHIEKNFEGWMSWNNHAIYTGNLNEGWQLDHVIPLSSAKTLEELEKLTHYTNIKPLCAYKNMYIKKSKLNYYGNI